MEMVAQSKNTLVFCVALNGYNQIYRQCIDSHKNYAKQHGYQYVLIDHPNDSITATVWLKIPLLIQALNKGYDWVAFIDADCHINPHTPPLQSLEKKDKSLYMAKGFSGNINSGVIIAKQCVQVRTLLQQIFDNCNRSLPEADWGENGHVIHYAQNWAGLSILDRHWNNNAEPDLQDYIRHYSAGGPMRCLYPSTKTEYIWRCLYRFSSFFKRRKYIEQSKIKDAVLALLQRIENKAI